MAFTCARCKNEPIAHTIKVSADPETWQDIGENCYQEIVNKMAAVGKKPIRGDVSPALVAVQPAARSKADELLNLAPDNAKSLWQKIKAVLNHKLW